jgi:hypothetical protein
MDSKNIFYLIFVEYYQLTTYVKKQSVICIRALLENSIASMYDVYDMSMKKNEDGTI